MDALWTSYHTIKSCVRKEIMQIKGFQISICVEWERNVLFLKWQMPIFQRSLAELIGPLVQASEASYLIIISQEVGVAFMVPNYGKSIH